MVSLWLLWMCCCCGGAGEGLTRCFGICRGKCWYLSHRSSCPKLGDVVASPVWVPPSPRCSASPGSIQAGNSPAHPGRWDLERLHPSSPCSSGVPAAPARWGLPEPCGHTGTGLGTHPCCPAWNPQALSSLPPCVTVGTAGPARGGCSPGHGKRAPETRAARGCRPRKAVFPHCLMLLWAVGLFLSPETRNSAELLCVGQREHTATGSCSRNQGLMVSQGLAEAPPVHFCTGRALPQRPQRGLVQVVHLCCELNWEQRAAGLALWKNWARSGALVWQRRLRGHSQAQNLQQEPRLHRIV